VSLSGFGPPEAGVQLTLDLDTVGIEVTGPDPLGPSGARDRTGHRGDDDEEVEEIQRSWGPVTAAVDAIRERYGGSSVGSAALVGSDGLRVRRRGEAKWGPGQPSPQ
jgi:hypothetical protein